MQLSTLHSMVATRFPGSNISVIATSRLVTDVFPNVRAKRVGKKKVSNLIGIELRHQPSPPFPPDTAGSPPFPPDTAGSPPFPPDTAGSPPFPGTSSSLSEAAKITALQLELAVERDRRAALELEIEMLKKRVPARSEVQSAAQYQQLLCSEVDSAVCSRQMLLHGPDTVERFAEFSMSAVITELQASCPQLYRLVQQLGCTQRNARGGRLLASFPGSPSFRAIIPCMTFDPPQRKAEGEPGRFCHMIRVMKRHPYIRYRHERFVSMSSTLCIVGIGLRSETKNLC